MEQLELRISNRLAEIVRVSEAFNELAGRHAFSPKLQHEINFVFDELLNNIITYAYEDEDEHFIDVHIRLSQVGLTVTITDDGKPFNPFESHAPDTALSVEDRPIGGLGVHLVRNVMDRVGYERHGEKNVVLLGKAIESSQEASTLSSLRRTNMNISTTNIESVAVVRLEGNLDTNTSSDAQESLNQLIEGGAAKILVNFTGVDFVSSAGLRILLTTAKKLSAAGGNLRISNLNETVSEVFEISGFSTILDVFGSEEDGLQGF